jgi:hypothetical protein
VRLNLLLTLQGETCLDVPGWSGEWRATVGGTGQVKTGVVQALKEVRLEEEQPPSGVSNLSGLT